jgi:hypothetical protein
VSPSPNKTEGPRTVITVDALPEDEERQDELNRTMRKPGAPPYNPNAKWLDPADSTPNSVQGGKVVLPVDGSKDVSDA